MSCLNLHPSSGPVAGGNCVIISGKDLRDVIGVKFGECSAIFFTLRTHDQLEVIVPPGIAGVVPVTLTRLKSEEEDVFYTYVQNSWIGAIAILPPGTVLSAPRMITSLPSTLQAAVADNITLFATGTNKIFDLVGLTDESVTLALNSDGSRMYVPLKDQPLVQIYCMLPGKAKLIGSIPTGGDGGSGSSPYAFDIVVTPDDSTAYVSNLNTGILSVLDLRTSTLKTVLALSVGLASLAITPDGKTVYVDNYFFGTLTTINVSDNTVRSTLSVGGGPGMISITPDGKTAYVAASFSDTISIIDVSTETIVGSIALPAGSGPYGCAILPNGKTMYVANSFNNTVTVVRLSDNSIISTLTLPAGFRSILGRSDTGFKNGVCSHSQHRYCDTDRCGHQYAS